MYNYGIWNKHFLYFRSKPCFAGGHYFTLSFWSGHEEQLMDKLKRKRKRNLKWEQITQRDKVLRKSLFVAISPQNVTLTLCDPLRWHNYTAWWKNNSFLLTPQLIVWRLQTTTVWNCVWGGQMTRIIRTALIYMQQKCHQCYGLAETDGFTQNQRHFFIWNKYQKFAKDV